MQRVVAFIIIGIALCSAWTSARPPTVRLLSVTDAANDDRGHGQVHYPEDATFPPGLFDITQFQIYADDTHVYFHFRFARITNPWLAPEGFYHQRIDVFIHTGNDPGRTDLLRPGPGILRFSSRYPWHMWLRIAPWDGAALFHATDAADATGNSEGLSVKLLDDNTIQVSVPKSLLGIPQRQWRYYVLIGSFDALGVDGYRLTKSNPSRWLLQSDIPDMRVLDIIAPSRGRYSQRRQLRPASDGIITLHPLTAGRPPYVWGVLVLVIVALAGGIGLTFRRRLT